MLLGEMDGRRDTGSGASVHASGTLDVFDSL